MLDIKSIRAHYVKIICKKNNYYSNLSFEVSVIIAWYKIHLSNLAMVQNLFENAEIKSNKLKSDQIRSVFFFSNSTQRFKSVQRRIYTWHVLNSFEQSCKIGKKRNDYSNLSLASEHGNEWYKSHSSKWVMIIQSVKTWMEMTFPYTIRKSHLNSIHLFIS